MRCGGSGGGVCVSVCIGVMVVVVVGGGGGDGVCHDNWRQGRSLKFLNLRIAFI